MSLFISKCIQSYRSTFPRNWIDDYRDESDEFKQLEGFAKINAFYKDIFILLSKAVLSGEYINDTKRYKILLDGFLAEIAIEAGQESIRYQYSKLNSTLKEALTNYKYLLSQIEDKIANSDEDPFFSAFESIDKEVENQYLSDFISICIELALIDHFLYSNKKNKISLILIRETLIGRNKIENPEIKAVYSALLDKCDFLLKKIFYDPVEGRTYTLNFEHHSIDEIACSQSKLKDMSLKFDFLYDPNFKISSFKDRISEYQDNCILRTSKASELILLMKYYQKDKCSSQRVKNLLESFDGLYNKIYKHKIKNPFGTNALNSIKNYLYNCKFSIDISGNSYTFESLKKDILQLEELQSETGINNYFPFYKALQFLERKISLDFSSTSNNLSQIRLEIQYFSELIGKFEKNLQWCIRNRYYPFQLLANECITPDEEIPIFMASSFNRPINYQKLQNKLNDFSLRNKFFDNQFELAKEKQEILALKENVKSFEKRNFEYLSVFIAIITFLFASIPIFASTELTLQGSLTSILSLGIVLVLFINLLKVFQNTSKVNTNIWFGISISLFILIFILVKQGML